MRGGAVVGRTMTSPPKGPHVSTREFRNLYAGLLGTSAQLAAYRIKMGRCLQTGTEGSTCMIVVKGTTSPPPALFRPRWL